LYNQFYGDFESFCKTIDDCIENADEKFADELKTLMTLNFQSFENVQFLAVSGIVLALDCSVQFQGKDIRNSTQRRSRRDHPAILATHPHGCFLLNNGV